jgi:hypothetical protein
VDVADDFATTVRRFAAENAKYISTFAAPGRHEVLLPII